MRQEPTALLANDEELIDPDPFAIALGIMGVVAGGAAFLETRRARRFHERAQRDRFRAAWFEARRTLIHFQQVLAEFELFMLEDGYGGKSFQLGAVQLRVDHYRHRALRRIHAQTLNTATHLADDIDDLSEFLGPEDQERVDHIKSRLAEMAIPERFGQVILLAREGLALFNELLQAIDQRERFQEGN